MEMPISEVADRYTILAIKKHNGMNVEIPDAYVTELIGVDVSELYKINATMFRLEDMIKVEESVEKVGAFYLALRWMSHKRMLEKNRIAEQFGQTKEVKNY